MFFFFKGKGATTHKQSISREDIKKLYGDLIAFNIDTPSGLQNKVFFELMFYVCRRGQENLRTMKKDTFEIKTDSTGLKYLQQSISEIDKNHRDGSASGEGRMYETGKKSCPISSYEKYLHKLSSIDALWQRPLESFLDGAAVWYYKSPMGVNTLAAMMPKISRMIPLSQIYTNHCIRATCITALDASGYEARHIMKVSGHKSEASIRSYTDKLTDSRKRKIAETISSALGSSQEQSDEEGKKHKDEDEVNLDIAAAVVNVPHTCPSTLQQAASSKTMQDSHHMQFNQCTVEIHYHR